MGLTVYTAAPALGVVLTLGPVSAVPPGIVEIPRATDDVGALTFLIFGATMHDLEFVASFAAELLVVFQLQPIPFQVKVLQALVDVLAIGG